MDNQNDNSNNPSAGGPVASEEKCTACGNTASVGNCVPCGQNQMSCACPPVSGEPTSSGGDMGQGGPTPPVV